jgi:hypothetical protein
MTGREVMEMVDTLDRGSAEIARLRALNAELVAALAGIFVWAIAGKPREDAYANPKALANWREDFDRMKTALAKADQC